MASEMLRLSSSLLKFSRAAAVREGVPGDTQAATLRTIGELGGVVVVMFDGPAFVEPDTIDTTTRTPPGRALRTSIAPAYLYIRRCD